MNNNILIELLDKQLKNIDITKKLSYNDLKRISNNISSFITTKPSNIINKIPYIIN